MATKTQSKKPKTQVLPKRAAVKVGDQWDLTQLFATDAAWEKDFGKWEGQIKRYGEYKGKLGESAGKLVECLRFDAEFDRLGERLGSYASLKASGDQGDSAYQRMKGRYHHVAVKAAEAAGVYSAGDPGDSGGEDGGVLAAPELAEWKLALERVVRYRPHTLSNAEEELLAMSGQMSEACESDFSAVDGHGFEMADGEG